MTLGEKLLRLRKARSWSQEELAERIGVTRQAVSRWESGSAKPDADKIIVICDIFGISADYLLREDYTAEALPQQKTQPSGLSQLLQKLTLKQWGGVALMLTGGLVLLILKIVYALSDNNYIYLGATGYFAFLLFEELFLLWCLALAAVIGGAWRLFLKKRLKESEGIADLKTMFDIE